MPGYHKKKGKQKKAHHDGTPHDHPHKKKEELKKKLAKIIGKDKRVIRDSEGRIMLPGDKPTQQSIKNPEFYGEKTTGIFGQKQKKAATSKEFQKKITNKLNKRLTGDFGGDPDKMTPTPEQIEKKKIRDKKEAEAAKKLYEKRHRGGRARKATLTDVTDQQKKKRKDKEKLLSKSARGTGVAPNYGNPSKVKKKPPQGPSGGTAETPEDILKDAEAVAKTPTYIGMLKQKIADKKKRDLQRVEAEEEELEQAKKHKHIIEFKGHTGQYYRRASLISSQGKYAKYWLLNAKQQNGNGWGVSQQSIAKNIHKFIGRPLVVTAKSWHPESVYGDQFEHPYLPTNDINKVLDHQEQYRIGNIVDVIEKDGDYFANIEINQKFANMILPPFCSPAIFQNNPAEPEGNISDWEALHLAALMEDPAYGSRIALLRGSCVGTKDQCSIQFKSAKQQAKMVCTKGIRERIAVLKKNKKTSDQTVDDIIKDIKDPALKEDAIKRLNKKPTGPKNYTPSLKDKIRRELGTKSGALKKKPIGIIPRGKGKGKTSELSERVVARRIMEDYAKGKGMPRDDPIGYFERKINKPNRPDTEDPPSAMYITKEEAKKHAKLRQRIAGIVDKIKKDTNKELEHSKRMRDLLKYTPKQPMSTKETMAEHGYLEHGEKIRPDKETMELEKRFDVDDIDAERTKRIDQYLDYTDTLTNEELSAQLSHEDFQAYQDFILDGKPLPPNFLKKKKTNIKSSKLKQRLSKVRTSKDEWTYIEDPDFFRKPLNLRPPEYSKEYGVDKMDYIGNLHNESAWNAGQKAMKRFDKELSHPHSKRYAYELMDKHAYDKYLNLVNTDLQDAVEHNDSDSIFQTLDKFDKDTSDSLNYKVEDRFGFGEEPPKPQNEGEAFGRALFEPFEKMKDEEYSQITDRKGDMLKTKKILGDFNKDTSGGMMKSFGKHRRNQFGAKKNDLKQRIAAVQQLTIEGEPAPERVKGRQKNVARFNEEVIQAFKEGKPLRGRAKLKNGVRQPPAMSTDGKNFFLFGNKIAAMTKNGGLKLNVKKWIKDKLFRTKTFQTLRDLGVPVDNKGIIDSNRKFFTKDGGFSPKNKINANLFEKDVTIPSGSLAKERVYKNKPIERKKQTGFVRPKLHNRSNLEEFSNDSRERATSMQVNSEGKRVPLGTLKGDPTGISKRSLSETATQPSDAMKVNRILGFPKEHGLEKTFGKKVKGKYQGIEGSKTHHILYKSNFRRPKGVTPLERLKHTRHTVNTPPSRRRAHQPLFNNPNNAIQMSDTEHSLLHSYNPHSGFRKILYSKLKQRLSKLLDNKE